MKKLFILLVLLTVAIACRNNDPLSTDVDSYPEISLNKSELSLEIGMQERLLAAYIPADTEFKGHTWESTSPSIATVDEGGLVTAVSKGSSTIIVKALNGGKTAKCNVTVVEKEINVSSIKLDPEKDTLFVGETLQIKASVLPENATNKRLKWVSGNSTIASVDNNGKVNAISAGETNISVSTEDGNKTALCNLTVLEKGIEFSKPEVSNITSNTALIKGVVQPLGVKIQEMGICFSTTATPDIKDTKIVLSNINEISYTLSGLQYETIYYVRFYAIVEGVANYSDQTEFKTLSAIEFSTPEIANVSTSSALIKAQITTSGITLKEVGFLVSKSQDLITTGNKITLTGKNFQYTLSSLEPETTYYVCTYAIIGEEYFYSAIVSFTTLEHMVFKFNTTDVYYNYSGDDNLFPINKVLLEAEAPNGIKEVQVCYAYTPNPTIMDYIATAKLQDDGKLHLELSGIKTGKIYLRAFNNVNENIEYFEEEAISHTYLTVIQLKKRPYKDYYWESVYIQEKNHIKITYDYELFLSGSYKVFVTESNNCLVSKGGMGNYTETVYTKDSKGTIIFAIPSSSANVGYEGDSAYMWWRAAYLTFMNMDTQIKYHYRINSTKE